MKTKIYPLTISVFFALILFLVISACSDCANNNKNELHGSYYWTLPLHSPEEAVDLFVKSFRKEDYLTVYLILSRDNQKEWNKACMQMSMARFMGVKQKYSRDLASLIADKNNEHFSFGNWYAFSIVLRHIVSDIGLPIPFSEVVIDQMGISRQANEASLSSTLREDRQLRFSLERSPNGRWRIMGVELSGADGERVVWPST